MEGKNFKNSFAIKEAENIIENYIKDRENSNIEKYYQLKGKYERLKMFTISIFFVIVIETLWHILF